MLSQKGKFEKKHLTKFILMMPGRTGSSYIIERLNSHPNIVAETELFGGGDTTEEITTVRKRLQRLYEDHYSDNIKAVGFKTKIRGNVNPVYSDLRLFKKKIIQEMMVTKSIILLRNNLVKQAISRIRTELLKKRSLEQNGTKIWNIRQDNDKVLAHCISPEVFDFWLKKYSVEKQELIDFSRSLEIEELTIYYEDLLGNDDKLMEKIFNFLDVPKQSTHSGMIKHTNDDLSKVVKNFDELLTKYKGTVYEAMFLEGVNRNHISP